MKSDGILPFFKCGFAASILIICFISIPSMACTCLSKTSDIEEIYSKSEGIYLAAISGIWKNKSESNRNSIEIELTVLKAFKGKMTSKINAKGYATLPKATKQGVETISTSCDMDYVFGSTYIVAVYPRKETILANCSENVIGNENWQSLALMGKQKSRVRVKE